MRAFGIVLLVAVVIVGGIAPAARAADTAGLGRAAAEKLMARKALRPDDITVTDFRGDGIGCITLSSRELRQFGFFGHAFFCETAPTGEILGAVLSRRGFVRCYISGDYAGDACYDFTICGIAQSACVQ